MASVNEGFVSMEVTKSPTNDMEEYAAHAVEQSRKQAALQRKQRQAEGIAAAKARGVQFGRPKTELPPHFALVVEELDQKRITTDTARRLCGMTRSTFSRRLQSYRRECGIKK